MDISIIIINYNTKQLLYNCLTSLYNNTIGVKYEVIIVDNGSTDGSYELITKSFPEVLFINAGKNLGFGKGNNLGVKHATGEFLFLLNSDTILYENSIKMLYDFYCENEQALKIGVLGCKLVDENLQTINSGGGFPWVKNDLMEYYYLIKEKVTNKKIPARDTYDFNLPFFELDYVIGADMFMRKKHYDAVGGFDHAYFMYYEESDMQMALRKLGYKCYVITKTSIIHLEGGSTDRQKYSPFKRLVNQISRNYYFKKNDKKNYPIYLFTDMVLNLTRIFNRNYTFKENLDFVIKNIKSY
ncbi:glycosyltransferase family 2 protein [Pedobacter terrae]|uniref:glycosyltransferase family 2 protein n=1 Tax=Pedobacter terrae TaxID=405671 RepID=UPI002FF9B20D